MKHSSFLALAFSTTCGFFTLILSIAVAFNLIGGDEHISDRIKGSITLFLISFILFFPAYEYVKKRFFGEKTWSEIATECHSSYLVMSKLNMENSYKKTIIYCILFILYIFIPIIASQILNIKPVFRFSLHCLVVLWVAIFPALVLSMWNIPNKAKNKEHKKLLVSSRWLLPAFFTLYLLFYVEILANYTNIKFTEFVVNIDNVRYKGRRYVQCNEKVSGVDVTGLSFSICIENVSNNLVQGNVAYIDDGQAIIKGRVGWIGVIVDSITWDQQYTVEDRIWSVQEQKYIYKDKL